VRESEKKTSGVQTKAGKRGGRKKRKRLKGERKSDASLSTRWFKRATLIGVGRGGGGRRERRTKSVKGIQS